MHKGCLPASTACHPCEYMAEYVANPAFRTLLDSNINQVMSKYGVELGDIKLVGQNLTCSRCAMRLACCCLPPR